MKKNRIEALVIGCGNIGAMYDLEVNDILTHCKAISRNKNFNLTVFDTDPQKSDLVSNFYKCNKLNDLEDIGIYDIVSICTPTDTHFTLLNKLFSLDIPLIICEKPISNNIQELEILKIQYAKSTTNILVNYFRRFHPSYIELKNKIKSISQNNKLVSVSVKYQRGFLNNCSHAIDLLEFILDQIIDFNSFKLTNVIYDSFEYDPTVSMIGTFNDVYYSFVGLANVKYSFFEIELFFQNSSIKIAESGNSITYFKSFSNQSFYMPLVEEKEVRSAIKYRMKHVIAKSNDIYINKLQDNFLASLDLNQRMLSILNT